MSNNLAFFIELVLVFGGVLAWAVWELWSVRRDQRRSSAKRTRHPEGEHGPDEG